MSNDSKTSLPRRQFIQKAGAALLSTAVAAPMVITSRKAMAASSLVVVSWGGTYRDGVEKALVKPFEKEFGVQVILADTPDLAKVKAQMESKNVQWDIFDAPGPMAMTGSKNGYWEPLDPALFNQRDLMWPLLKDAVPQYSSMGGLCWDNSKFPDGKHPETFAEYFDFKRFPGKRTLRNRAPETLEIALLADGVAPDAMYPLDVERAFKSLSRIKPYVGNWVEQTPQTVTLLETGQVDFSYSYSSRVRAMQLAKKPIHFSFKQNVLGLGYLVCLKNAPNKANAMKYLQFALRPDRQAALMNELVNIPASRSASALMNPEAKTWQPDPSNKLNVVLNDAWWADHFDELTLRFKEWVRT